MDFNKFYKQQELLEFTGQNAVSNIAQAAGKVVGGAFNLMGAGAKALVGGIAKVMKDVVGKIREPLKQKWDAIIKLAEEIYPYDKAIYDSLKADKNTAIREIDTYLELASKKSLPTKYSVGLDIVYRVYAMTLAQALKMDINKPLKLSIKTLEDAKNKVKNVQFPQMKNNTEVDRYFDTYLKNDSSMLRKWTYTGSVYCVWKNEYNNTDEEGMNSIVDQINSSSLSNMPVDYINAKMKELKEADPPKEVNVQNLSDSIEMTKDAKFQAVKKVLDEKGTSIILPENLQVNDEDVKFLSDKFLGPHINAVSVANAYVSMSRLIDRYNKAYKIQVVFEKHPNFYNFFSVIRDPENRKVYESMKSNAADKQALMENFMLLNADGIDSNGTQIKITEEMVQDIDKVFKAISTNLTATTPKV
jgi:adenylate cyclase class IV